MTPPKHIWSGPWLSESERHAAGHRHAPPLPSYADPQAPQAAPPEDGHETAGARSGPPPESPPPRPSRRRGAGILALLCVALVAGAAGAGVTVLLTGGDETPATRTVVRSGPPTPAAAPLKPQSGQSVASAVFAAASPAVVSIRAGSGGGTGFLIDDRGTIVTNDHVVEAGASSTVKLRFGTRGKIVSGTVLATDPSTDLAAIRIRSADVPAGVQPLQFADSDRVEVGADVFAIGNPFGLERTLTTGVVSSLGRTIVAPNRFPIDRVIQTDAAINPGNSGGPLLDAAGRVIGVNSQILTGSAISQSNIGIGFAVPSNTVQRVLPTLISGRTFEHAWLGVTTTPTTRGNLSGAEIADLAAGGPAARAGLQTGDVITAIDGKRLEDSSLLSEIVDTQRPGDKVEVTVTRRGTEQRIAVVLGTRPRDTDALGGGRNRIPTIP